MPVRKRFFQHQWIRSGAYLLLLIILWQLERFPFAVEKYYTNTIYKAISDVQHLLFSWLPFSFGDLFYIALILVVLLTLFNLFKFLFTGRFNAFAGEALKIIIGVESAFLIFYFFWGINYYRPPAAQLLDLRDTNYTIGNVKAITRMIIDSANSAHDRIGIADLTQSESVIHNTAVKAIKSLSTLSPKYQVFMPAVKSSMLSPLLNYMGTSGYYNPFTGEAQINKLMPVFDRPFTACHEIAHQIGFAHEDEANFVGFLAGIKSHDRLLNYSAYYEATFEFLHYLHRRDTIAYKELRASLKKGVREDIKTDSLYWSKYEGELGNMSSRFYDNFLKANQQPAGLRTYNRMIILTMAWYKKQHLY